MAKPEKRKKAQDLRRQGWSIRSIEKELGVSKSSVSRWTRDIELSDEQQKNLKRNQIEKVLKKGSQANSKKHLLQRRNHQVSGREYARLNRPLHLKGCMLYWAEGSKDRNRLEFVNSDIHMMALFVKFLRHELKVTNDIISIRITCHATQQEKINMIEAFWLQLLKLPKKALRKTQIKIGTTSRRNKLKYGMCSIRVDRTELVQHIFGAIQEYGNFETDDWLT